MKRTFDEYHVRFIAANDNLDTANGFDIMSIFRDVINEWYVADTSRKIKTVFKSRMEKGLRCSGSVSYGYLASKENKGEWVIDEEAAAVVRRIFHSVVAGESIASIARALRAEKIPIPSEHWKRIGAPVRAAKYTDPYAWSTTTISYTAGIEDSNGILFVRFPIMELAAALSRSPVTVKRSLKELEDIGLILRVRRGVGEPNRIYTLLPKGGLP